MATEIELKLALAPEDAARLARSPVLASATRSKPQTRSVYSVYYDTPERDLARRGMALRLRKVGRRWIQTLKTAGKSSAGLHARGEYEAPAAAQLLNFTALAATPAAVLFAAPEFRARLHPAFVTRFRRSTRTVEIFPGEEAELAVDRGTVTAGERETPICEVEIELRRGAPEHLFDFAQLLLKDVDLRLDNVSKAERGYALLAPQPPAPVRAAAPELDPAMSVPEAIRTVVESCVQHLQANEAGVLASEDVEYVHQARVAIRRLRSAFSVFRPVVPKAEVAELLQDLRALGNALGGARDWDVFVTETLPAAEAAFPGHAGLAALRACAESRRAAARARARDAIAARAYTELLLELGSQLAAMPWRTALDAEARATEALPLPAFAARVLARQAKRVRKHARDLEAHAPGELHLLRIEIKKLRYAAEFLQGLYGRRAVRQYLDGLTELQDILGRLNDAAVTEHLLGSLGQVEPDVVHAAGVVLGWTRARAEAGLDHLKHAWKSFESARRFW